MKNKNTNLFKFLLVTCMCTGISIISIAKSLEKNDRRINPEMSKNNSETISNIDVFPSYLGVYYKEDVPTSADVYYTENYYGSYDPGTYTVGYYLSKDSIFDSGDRLLATNALSGISPNAGTGIYYNVQFPELSEGLNYLLIVSDLYNELDEVDETNNTVSKVIYTPGNSSDLIIENIIVNTPGQAYPGGYVQAMFTERNIGTSSAPSNYLDFYLSNDPILDSLDTPISQSYANSIDPTSSVDGYLFFFVPNNITPGSYFIIGKADSQNNVSETDENNNEISVPFIIKSSSVDLTTVITTPEIDINYPNGLYIEGYFQNLGEVDSPPNLSGFYLSKDSLYSEDDNLIKSFYLNTIYPQGISNFFEYIYIDSLKEGKYYVLAKADISNATAETNEYNNVAYLRINVTLPKIDLSINHINLQDSTVAAGDNLVLYYNLINNGNANANPSYTTAYISKDTILSADDTYSVYNYEDYIDGGSSALKYMQLSIPPELQGEYYILLKADAYENVNEVDETNNTTFAKVTIKAPVVDLAIESATAPQFNVLIGTYLTTTFTEKNLGNTYIPEYYTGLVLSKDTVYNESTDIAIGTYYNYGLSPNSSYTSSKSFYIPNNIPAGEYYVIAQIDVLNRYNETNESNNTANVKVRLITPNVDLSINTQRVSSAKVVAGNPVTLTGYVNNHGTQNSTSNNVYFYLSKSENNINDSSVYLGSYYSYGIGPEASIPFNQSVSIPEYIPSGEYYVVFFADASNYQSETNEANNIVSKKITIEAATRDLTVKSASISSRINVEQTVYTKSTITNQGNYDVQGFNLGYYLSNDETYSSDDVYLGSTYVYGMLSKSAVPVSGEFKVPYYITSGKYKILFVADNFNGVLEINEENNVLAKGVQITNSYYTDFNQNKTNDSINVPVARSVNQIAISVAPNPASDNINVTVQTTEPSTEASYELYDSFGIKNKGGNITLENGKFSISAQDIPLGVYLLKVAFEGKIETIRVFKE